MRTVLLEEAAKNKTIIVKGENCALHMHTRPLIAWLPPLRKQQSSFNILFFERSFSFSFFIFGFQSILLDAFSIFPKLGNSRSWHLILAACLGEVTNSTSSSIIFSLDLSPRVKVTGFAVRWFILGWLWYCIGVTPTQQCCKTWHLRHFRRHQAFAYAK